jgi:hypothetical protein
MKGLVLQDDLSGHKTDIIEDFWSTEIKNFSPHWVPSNMTPYVLQVIDRHICICYRDYVYHIYCKEMIWCLNEIIAYLESETTVQKLNPAETRILITQAKGEMHKKLCNADAFE